jgi:hypothetical protein
MIIRKSNLEVLSGQEFQQDRALKEFVKMIKYFKHTSMTALKDKTFTTLIRLKLTSVPLQPSGPGMPLKDS